MARKAKYFQYDPRVKAIIAKSGNPDLFPELRIPRATAEYWIDQGFEMEDSALGSLAEEMEEIRRECADLKQRIKEMDAVMRLLHRVFKIMGFELRWKQVRSKMKKNKIIRAVEAGLQVASREQCLGEIGLSLSRYKRWRRERRGCKFTESNTCPKGNTNQLTAKEIAAMKTLISSKDFSHYPIRSLHYYAKREGLLFCSYSTWLKYIELFRWKRPRKETRKRKYVIGIRATCPNEIWHIDVSVFVLPNKTKCYIQAVVDNYSRFAIAWQVLGSYDGSSTVGLLRKALEIVNSQVQDNKKLRLIVDAGGENKNHEMDSLEGEGRFRKEVARFEISYSNSMIEAVFRSLKHNYLFQHEIVDLPALRRHVNFWFREHNEKIPHTAIKGETPAERFNREWSNEKEIRILLRQEEAIKLRIAENQKVSCEGCGIA